MATEIFRPNAGGTTTELTRWPGAAPPDPNVNYTLVDEETPDEASTMVYRGVESYTLDTYNIPDHSEGSETINHVKVYCRMQNSPAFGKVAIRTHNTEYYGDEENLTASWVNYSKQWDTNPNTGSAWTWDEIDALEIGVALKGGGGNSARCTQVYVEVDYTAITPKTSSDAGSGVEGTPMQAATLAGNELGQGSDSFIVKIETPTKGGGMKLWT
jgi:hypothetical protein